MTGKAIAWVALAFHHLIKLQELEFLSALLSAVDHQSKRKKKVWWVWVKLHGWASLCVPAHKWKRRTRICHTWFHQKLAVDCDRVVTSTWCKRNGRQEKLAKKNAWNKLSKAGLVSDSSPISAKSRPREGGVSPAQTVSQVTHQLLLSTFEAYPQKEWGGRFWKSHESTSTKSSFWLSWNVHYAKLAWLCTVRKGRARPSRPSAVVLVWSPAKKEAPLLLLLPIDASDSLSVPISRRDKEADSRWLNFSMFD